MILDKSMSKNEAKEKAIEYALEIPFSKSQKQLMKRYSLTENAAQEYMDKFWK